MDYLSHLTKIDNESVIPQPIIQMLINKHTILFSDIEKIDQ